MRMRRIMTVLAGLVASSSVLAAAPEFRGMWVTRFEWVSPEPGECKANITRILEAIAGANFNAAVFQIRGAADTLYPSSLEPWSRLIGEKDPGFDPVAFAIAEARRLDLQFHAYMNPMPLVETRWDSPPGDPSHLWHRHGPQSAEPWVCVDAEGRPSRSEYYYLSAGVPGVQAHIRNVIMDVVRRYDVDGIHLDRIRYPGAEYSHDAISRARFAGRGNPQLLDYEDWQRHQLDKLINDLAAEIRAEKPKVALSCAAWGIYNRHHLDGYITFSSGYHDYYQDTWNWCRIGAMDLLMPMIYWNLADPKPNYDELVRDFIRGVGAEHVVGGQRAFGGEETTRQIELTREAGAFGSLLYSHSSSTRRGIYNTLPETLYKEQAPVPALARVEKPEHGSILGTVVADDGSPLLDAWVALQGQGGRETRRRREVTGWTSGEDGRFAFHKVAPGTVRIAASYDGVPGVTSEPVEVKAGEVTRVQITIPGAGALREKAYVAILQPPDGYRTSQPVVHLLGRTQPGQRVAINGEPVEVYSSGAFARDEIALQPGENRIEVTAGEGDRAFVRTLTVTRVEAEQPAAVTTLRVVEPAEDVALLPGDLLEIRAEGPSGMRGEAVLFDGKLKVPLTSAGGADTDSRATYVGAVRVPESLGGLRSGVRVILSGSAGGRTLQHDVTARIEVWDPASVRVGEATSDETGIVPGLHDVRLGGPWLTWVARGTRFEVTGRRGGMYQVRLSPTLTGWVSQRQVQLLPAGTPPPSNYFTSCDVSGRAGEDTLSIGMRAPVVVTVRAEIEPSIRLSVDIFNTHDALTWISHKSTASIIGPVQSEQIETGRVRLTVPVSGKRLGGYWTEMKDGRFVLHVRHPSPIAPAPESSLKGLLIAVEAGHGGSNSGAVGHLGTKEKTINQQAAVALQRELEARGAKVIQVRNRDEEPGLGTRAARASEANADFFVSIHANAASNARGFLRVSGTSTYYHGLNGRLPAELVYKRLLALGWGEFGVVGNFSYAPLRNTRVPALLVEQAFMTHPGDEARMLEPEYQRKQATAIADGLAEYFDRMRE